MSSSIKIALLQKKGEHFNRFFKILKFIMFKRDGMDNAITTIQANSKSKKEKYIYFMRNVQPILKIENLT